VVDLWHGRGASSLGMQLAFGARRLGRVAGWLRAARSRDLFFSVPFALLVLVLFMSPVLLRPGWPWNHESLVWKYRTLIYAAHFRRWDLFPIWSESVVQGYGAPFPLLYHKLYSFPSALCYLAMGSVKAATLTTLSGFTLLGLLGMRAVLLRWSVQPRAALVAAAAFVFCNYAYTDWFVRGAFAEYTALCLLPWLLRWFLAVVEGEPPQRLWRQGALLFPALYLAHTVLFFFSAVPVLGAVAYRLWRYSDRRAVLLGLVRIGAVYGAVAAPIAVAQLAVMPEVTFREGASVFLARDHFHSVVEHLTGGAFAWGNDYEALSVKLDTPLLVAAVGSLITLLRAALARPAAVSSSFKPARGYWAAWIWVAYLAFLLTPAALPLYEHAPGFWALQFPWRLLAFLSPLAVALAVYPLFHGVRLGRFGGELCAWFLLAITLASSPWLSRTRYTWYSRAELERPLAPGAQLHVGAFEYHPHVEGVEGRAIFDHLDALVPRPSAREWQTLGYHVARTDPPAFEGGLRSYQVRAERLSSIILPIAYSPFIRVERVEAGVRARLPVARTPEDPRLRVELPAGESLLEVRYPTLLSLYRDLLRGRP
jgi:hypothetical protein